MKAKISIDTLRDGINKIQGVVDRKNSRPILTNCLVVAANGQLTITATDLEVSAKIILNADVEKNGSLCISTKNISEILRELPDGELNLEIIEQSNLLKLHCGSINFTLHVSSTEDFPDLSFGSSLTMLEISSENILNIINKTFHAVSTDETRLYLNGIFLQLVDDKLRAVAIDGHRLALYDVENFVVKNRFLTDGIIIPKKGINELKKVAESYPNTILKISLDESFIYLNAGNSYFLSIRLIARDYPKYQSIIPSKVTYSLSLDKLQLLNSIKRIKVLANEKTNGIKLNISQEGLLINTNHPSLGDASELITVSYAGSDISIAFNAKYLIDVMSVLPDGDIVFEFNNELSPVIIKSNNLNNFLGIIMPLKL